MLVGVAKELRSARGSIEFGSGRRQPAEQPISGDTVVKRPWQAQRGHPAPTLQGNMLDLYLLAEMQHQIAYSVSYSPGGGGTAPNAL
jgi:hypothetical protein